MEHRQDDVEQRDLGLLNAEQLALLPGMTDKGRLGFAILLKFIELYGRFPEDNRQINTDVAQALAKQLSVPIHAIASYDPCSRQGQRHRRIIRDFLGYRPSTGTDLKQLFHWLCHEVLPLDPLARHGRDVAFDWYRTQRIEPPASDELDKTIRSAVRHYETLLQADIYNRLSIDSKVAINHLLSTEDTDENKKTSGSNLSKLKMDPGKPSLENVLTVIYQLKLLDKVALKPEIFERIPAKFIEIFQQHCATESVREIRRPPSTVRYTMVAMFCWRRRQQLTDALIEMLMLLIHNLGTRAEKRSIKSSLRRLKRSGARHVCCSIWRLAILEIHS